MKNDSDFGTPEAQNRGKKIAVPADNNVGGAECLFDEWATYPRFLLDMGLLTQDQADAGEAFISLYDRTHTASPSAGSAGDGSLYQSWIDLGIALGPAHLKMLHQVCIEQKAPAAPPNEYDLWSAKKAHRSAVRMGNLVLAEYMGDEVRKMQNMMDIRKSVINLHKTRFHLCKRAIIASLDKVKEILK